MGLMRMASRRVKKLLAWAIAIVVMVLLILAAGWLAVELGVIP